MGIIRHCVFCGLKPQDISKEHIIPRWLIELTGDLGRTANFGLIKDVDSRSLSQRAFAFDKFTFPACSSCNQSFSRLEANVKKTMVAVLNAETISALALSEMLDWFDKVRVGLWLGMRMLDKDIAKVQPNFHIATRLGLHDRLLIVEKSDFQGKRLTFSAATTLNFALTPSAFMLIVNNYYFTNVSSMFLCSRRLGFPYAEHMRMLPDREETEVYLAAGRERVMRPVLRRTIAEKGHPIYQPMFRAGSIDGGSDAYDCDYVRQHSLNFSQGVGNIYVDKPNGVEEVGVNDQITIEPSHTQLFRKLEILSSINVLEWQLWMHEELPSMELLSSDHRRYIKARFGGADRMNKVLIQNYRKML